MTHLSRAKSSSILKWVSSNFVNCQQSLLLPRGSFVCTLISGPRFYSRKTLDKDNTFVQLDEIKTPKKFSAATRRQAQAALLDYLHLTRSLRFSDAENMSKNTPHFLDKLLRKVDVHEDVGKSVARYLRYHPINEFEPFFESLGLEQDELVSLLQRDMLFLSNDDLMMQNYYILCEYGIQRNRIGKIYEEAREAFCCDVGVLATKFRAYEELGFDQSFVAKLIACSPCLLTERGYGDFIKVLGILKRVGIEIAWIKENFLENTFFKWSQIHSLLDLLITMGYTDKQLCCLIIQHPGFLLEDSGNRAFLLIGFLLKFGSTMSEICSMFLQFPQMQVGEFVLNLRRCFLLLHEIEMEVDAIGQIFRSHALLLGSTKIKKPNTLFCNLNVGKKRLCQLILGNPQELNKWVLGAKLETLPKPPEEERSRMPKILFLLNLGYAEHSQELEKAVKNFRGRAADLPGRFDCIVNAGLDREDVSEMVKVAPQILNQKKNVLEAKIKYLVEDMGFPVSSLVAFPAYLSYTTKRVKLRLSMYSWLTNQGAAEPRLSLSTVIACSEKVYVKRYVECHPKGLEVWGDLKRRIYSE